MTRELREKLTEKFSAHASSKKELKDVAITVRSSSNRFIKSAIPFVQRLIAQNRELFEKLAQQ